MIELEGAYTALITPFSADGSAVDYERLARNIDHQSIAGVAGVVPCGTTGETPTLTGEEFRRVVEWTVRTARPLELTVIAGAGSNSTAHAIEQHRFVQQAGADAALHVTPYYNKPSQEGLFRHFSMIADSCDLPIVLYNIPGRTAVMLNIDTIQRLAAHPNIVAVKEATGSPDLAAQIVDTTDLTVLSGDDPLTLPLASLGAMGVISVLGNVIPDRVAALCNAFLAGAWEEARSINDRILPLARALLKLDTNPVPVKAALEVLGCDTGALRPPLVRASDGVMGQLRELIEAYDVVPEPVTA
jgi:4-hydroxy-tetrahydrodipicolinate synthase